MEEVNLYQPPERDTQLSSGPQTALSLDGKRTKEIYLLDLEIGRLRQEEQLEQAMKERRESCQNSALVGRLSSSIISGYLVHFEEIFALLVDELLEDEVIRLNHLEAAYKTSAPSSQPQSRQTLQMMELVRSLEELCD